MQRGEIRWYRFGAPDKRRPVLLLTRDSALEFLGEVTMPPFEAGPSGRRRQVAAAIPRAVWWARAMMVIIGLTPEEAGKALASAT